MSLPAPATVAPPSSPVPRPGSAARSRAASPPGVRGLDRDHAVVVPGRLNALMAAVTAHAPRALLLPALAASAPGLRR